MFPVIQVRKDDSFEAFCFRSREDLDRFRAFCETYAAESGGNGYGAYWIYWDAEVALYESPPRASTTYVEPNRVKMMMRKLTMERTASDPPALEVAFDIGTRQGGITFSHDPLPTRQRPAVGDMFRVVRQSGLTQEESRVGEGRVMADRGETLEVIDSWNEEDDGSIKPDAERIAVRADKVMKIFDWKKRSRRR